MNTIQYYKTNVYGNERMYIVDKTIADCVRTLTSTQTLLPGHKTALEALGLTFAEVIKPTPTEN